MAVLLILVTLVIGAQAAHAEGRDRGERVVPACQEDEVIVGTGDFVAGRWTGYRCGPALDDFRVDWWPL